MLRIDPHIFTNYIFTIMATHIVPNTNWEQEKLNKPTMHNLCALSKGLVNFSRIFYKSLKINPKDLF